MAIGKPVFLIITAAILGLVSVSAFETGIASFYSPPYEPSACFGNLKKGVFVAGVSKALWANGAACGNIYYVNCTGPTNLAPHPCKAGFGVFVMVTDFCTEGCQSTINLSEDAFAAIADPRAGLIKIEYSKI